MLLKKAAFHIEIQSWITPRWTTNFQNPVWVLDILADRQLLRDLYDNFIILSVLAQIVIDSCKREYEIDANQEIERIASLPYMTMTRETERNGKTKTIKYDFPKFMKYTREIKYTKDGKELPQEVVDNAKTKLKARINP